MHKVFRVIIPVFIFVFFLVSPFFASAQSGENTDQRETRLRAELAQVEKEQAETEKILAATKNQTASIQRDILILSTKIKAAQLNIKAKTLIIETLGKDINKKQAKIEDLESHIDRGVETLAQIMRKTNEIDSYSFAEFILARENLSEAFVDIDNFQSLQSSLKDTFEEIRDDKTQTETEKSSLSKRKNQETDARATIESEKRNIEANEKEKQRLLNLSKGSEYAYGQLLKEKQQKAAQIRAALFALRGSASIPFGDALAYANASSKQTGVRAAFLLAVLTQESNLGANIGQCFLSDISNGNGVGKNTGTPFEQVMKAPRDTEPFANITNRLGRDWKSTPVSCPPDHTYYLGRGFGGGMGPSQFIPSTWELFKGTLGKLLGISADSVDPWNPQHAFMATAVYMRDLGAGAGTYTAERNSACRYYSGSPCTPGRKPANVFYGDDVMVIADRIQRTMIDPLQGL